MLRKLVYLSLVLGIFASGCSQSAAPTKAPEAKSENKTAEAPRAFGGGQSGPVGEEKEKFTLVLSIYAGWMPWYYANETGILKKWADSKNIEIEVVYMDYIPSVEAYVAEKADACVMTNMEMLDMPSAAGVDSTAIILGDYSNGNDAILTRNGLGFKDLKGKEVYLVELSVSHYVLVRGLEMNGMSETDVKVVNTSDADIAPIFNSQESQEAVVTWNPMVMEVEKTPGVKRIFDTSELPGEVLDLCVVNTKVLNANPAFGEALAGAWYEVMAIMSKRGPDADKALTTMADLAKCSLTEYKSQLATTAMYYTPQAALEYVNGAEIKEKMDYVRSFCFDHGLLGANAPSKDVVGIAYPDGTIQGDSNNVKFRFDATYMEKAADAASSK